MAETLLPTSIVGSITNGTGVVGDIQAIDSSYITVTSNTVSLTVRAAMADPSGTPQTGAGIQGVTVEVIRNATGGTGQPTVTATIHEAGSGTVLATPINVQTMGVVEISQQFSGTWDAAVLGTADGTAVEIQVIIATAGGGPNARSGNLGYIAWTAEIAAAPPTEAGSASAASAGDAHAASASAGSSDVLGAAQAGDQVTHVGNQSGSSAATASAAASVAGVLDASSGTSSAATGGDVHAGILTNLAASLATVSAGSSTDATVQSSAAWASAAAVDAAWLAESGAAPVAHICLMTMTDGLAQAMTASLSIVGASMTIGQELAVTLLIEDVAVQMTITDDLDQAA